MVKKKKYPKISPLYVKNNKGKTVEVLLKYDVYESIFEEISDLKKQLTELKKKRATIK